MFHPAFAVIEIIAGLACILLNKRFARTADNYHKKLLLRKYNDEAVLRAVYIAGGTFLMTMGFWQLLKW